MREIKFRFYSNLLGKFVIPDDSIFVGALKDSDMSPMQYTGLKDKHGIEIFEGDIVRDGYHDKYGVYSVVWDSRNHCWAFNSTDGRELEIIGNIYENKDLL